MKNYICPVCGFKGLEENPYNQRKEPSYEICPCCGFEFGFDSAGSKESLIEYRRRWIKDGARWFIVRLKPEDWDLETQLKNIEE